MKFNFVELPITKEIISLASNMYRLGWNERNGGNISVLLNEEESKCFENHEVIRTFPLQIEAKELAGKLFLVTGTGKYFRNIERDPEVNLGIVRIGKDGKTSELLDGFKGDGAPTSEFSTHLLSHIARLKKDKKQRVVLHCHATYTLAVSSILPEDEDEITRALWKVQTESIVVFPEGIGYLPWMVCGGKEIGEATAKKAEEYRAVIWGLHGIFAMGDTVDETFGLIETIEKAAKVYYLIRNDHPRLISNEQLKVLAKEFNVDYKPII